MARYRVQVGFEEDGEHFEEVRTVDASDDDEADDLARAKSIAAYPGRAWRYSNVTEA